MIEPLTWVEFGLLTTASQYMLGAAKITRWWHGGGAEGQGVLSRAPWVRALIRCPACCGTWLGAAGWALGASPYPRTWLGFTLATSAGMVLTAIGRSFMDLATE